MQLASKSQTMGGYVHFRSGSTIIKKVHFFLFFVIGLTQLYTAHAESRFWPREILLKYPTLIVFGPGRPGHFALTSGIVKDPLATKNRLKFSFLDLGTPWETPLSCSETIRPHGYIHTSAEVIETDEQVMIQFPVSLQLTGHFKPLQISRVLNWPLLKLSVLELKQNQNQVLELSPLYTQFFQVKDITKTAAISGPVNLNFDSILMSEPFQITRHTNYRIRLEWSADGICDESSFVFKMGDQFRLVRNHE